MKGTRIFLGQHAGRPAAARMVDGRLDDLVIDAADDLPRPGTIFRAVCDRPVKGQGGMFLRLGDGLTGWHRNAKGLAPGQTLLVQVTGHAEAGKAVPVSDRVLFKSRYCIVTPEAPGLNVARSLTDEAERDRLLEIAHDAVPERGGHGIILRSACDGVAAEDLSSDLAETWALAAQVLADTSREAERLLDGTGWLPEPLRTFGDPEPTNDAAGADEPGGTNEAIVTALPAFLTDEDEPMTEPFAVAAE